MTARAVAFAAFGCGSCCSQAISTPVTLPRESGVLSPLLQIRQGRHPQVVVTVTYGPLPLVKFLLSAEGIGQIAIGLIRRKVVHGHEVLEQRRATGRIADETDVLCLVAEPAEGLEAGEPLVAGARVAVPDFVAFQSILPAAGLAPVGTMSVHRPPDLVPLAARKEFRERGQARVGRERLQGQAQVGHARVYGDAGL